LALAQQVQQQAAVVQPAVVSVVALVVVQQLEEFDHQLLADSGVVLFADKIASVAVA